MQAFTQQFTYARITEENFDEDQDEMLNHGGVRPQYHHQYQGIISSAYEPIEKPELRKFKSIEPSFTNDPYNCYEDDGEIQRIGDDYSGQDASGDNSALFGGIGKANLFQSSQNDGD